MQCNSARITLVRKKSSMKVLHVIDSLGVGGGAEHSLAAQLPLLRDRGVDNSIAVLMPRAGGIQQRLTEDGFPVDVLKGTFYGKVRQLRRLIRTEQPDLVHVTLVNASFVARVACFGQPTVLLNSLVTTTYDPVKLNNLSTPVWKIGLLKTLDRLTAKLVNGGFHAITHAVANEATGVLGVPPERITVIPRGRSAAALGKRTNERRRASRAALGLSDGELMVLNVGRQDKAKAQEILIKSFGRVANAFPNARLILAGRDGDATPQISSALSESTVADRISLLGHRNDVGELLCAADILVFPSLYEGLGGVLIEAMALSCPIIASDAPAILEVLGKGEFGRVVPRGDMQALAASQVDLLGSPSARQLLADKALARFQECYEIGGVVELTHDWYRSFSARYI